MRFKESTHAGVAGPATPRLLPGAVADPLGLLETVFIDMSLPKDPEYQPLLKISDAGWEASSPFIKFRMAVPLSSAIATLLGRILRWCSHVNPQSYVSCNARV
jgi:hypothetical protein